MMQQEGSEVDAPAPAEAVRRELFHHVELWVADLDVAEKQWGPVMLALGCQPGNRWDNGCTWHLGGSYLVLEQSEAMLPVPVYDRMCAGLNHLAVRGDEHAVVAALGSGWVLRVRTDRAVHVLNGDGFELEIRLD